MSPRTSRPRRSPKARVGDWWRTRVDYPDPSVPFRPTAHLDLLSTLRFMMRLTLAAMLLFGGVIGATIVGHAPPGWAMSALEVASVFGTFAGSPPARYTLAGLALFGLRREWATAWEDAAVALPRLWMMLGSPMTATEFAAYAAVFGDDETARVDGGVDPRLVWALSGRGITPETVRAYREAGLTAVDAVAAHDADLSPQDWGTLTEARLVPKSAARHRTAILFVDWVRTSRASLHPTRFGEPGRRSLTACLPVLAAWCAPAADGASRRDPLVSLSRDWTCPAQQRTGDQPGLPCGTCGGTGGHRADVRFTPLAGHSVLEWVDLAGELAPFFVRARISYEEAALMVVADPPPTIESLRFLSAWQPR